MFKWLVALLLPLSVQAAWVPDEVGMSLYSLHGHYNSGPYAWNNKTVGPYGLWSITEVGEVSVKALLAAPQLSTRKQGLAAGVMLEYKNVFATVGAVSGYEKAEYTQWQRPGATKVCVGPCMYRTAEQHLVPYISVGYRFDLQDRWKLRVSYQPKPPGPASWGPFWDKYPDMRRDHSVTLWLGRAF
jgi:hypothetical protein